MFIKKEELKSVKVTGWVVLSLSSNHSRVKKKKKKREKIQKKIVGGKSKNLKLIVGRKRSNLKKEEHQSFLGSNNSS